VATGDIPVATFCCLDAEISEGESGTDPVTSDPPEVPETTVVEQISRQQLA
jgi:hypothetical protein